MATFTPNPNITRGPTQASGSTHQMTGSVTISGSLTVNGVAITGGGGGGSGDVSGPGSATDNAIARFNGAGGKTIQNSSVTIDDSNNLGNATTLSASDGMSAGAVVTDGLATLLDLFGFILVQHTKFKTRMVTATLLLTRAMPMLLLAAIFKSMEMISKIMGVMHSLHSKMVLVLLLVKALLWGASLVPQVLILKAMVLTQSKSAVITVLSQLVH